MTYRDTAWAGLVGVLCLALGLLCGCATTLKPKPTPLPDGIRFDGHWDSNWGAMDLEQDGQSVRGSYKYENGKIRGEIEGDILTFQWRQANNQTGRGWMQLSQDGTTIKGRWGYGEDEENGGEWKATRTERY